ncbi:hypothetical protein AQJ23_16230 [Streptomyces antibioticus]|nr:hypothetical protein [Streptomyces antibioticus]KUN25933.1 hypothetical protein AQJ23_16230 [Streptomyces antibioticus]
MQARQIHPGAYGALIEALASIYSYKKDLKKFLQTRATEHPELLVGLDFDGYKRAFAEEFVDRLMADEEQYRDLTMVRCRLGDEFREPAESEHCRPA